MIQEGQTLYVVSHHRSAHIMRVIDFWKERINNPILYPRYMPTSRGSKEGSARIGYGSGREAATRAQRPPFSALRQRYSQGSHTMASCSAPGSVILNHHAIV